ncbi:hypothetical protein [Helcococcus kunzii]|uniref:hypothetical protein n=1 Tax=Helcococcus kunzii TaxID=40091 RepID=UPI0024AE7A25|nr:hypothetical protein [Helcococcus kunzii]
MVYRELKKIIKYKSIIFFVIFFLLIISVMNLFITLEPNVVSSKKSFDNFKSLPVEDIGKDTIPMDFPSLVLWEADSLIGREKYIKDEIKNLDKKIKLPMLDSDEKKLLTLEKNSLSNIIGMDIKFSHTAYFYSYINNLIYSGFLFLCLLIFIFYYVFYQDIENSLITLYKTYRINLKKLYIYKFLAFLIFSFVILLMWATIDYIFLIISGTDKSLFIQNIKNFYFAPLKLRLYQYMFLNIGLIYLTLIFLIFLFSFLLFIFKRVGLAISGLFAFILLEFSMYNNIALGSSKEFFKLFNIFSIFDRPFKRTLPVKMITIGQVEYIVIIGISILLIGCLILSCILYGKGMSLNTELNGIFKGLRTNNILINEIYNIFIGSKGIVILVLLAIFSYISYEDFYYVRADNYEALSRDKREYYGEIDDKLLSKLEAKYNEAKKYSQRGHELLEKMIKTDEEEAELRALAPFFGKYQNLRIIRDEINFAKENGASYYVDTQSTDFLHSVNSKYNFYKDTFIGLGLISVMTALYISSNYNSKIERLYETMLRVKRRNLFRLILLYVVSLSIFAILIGTHIGKLYKGFFYRILDISINNIFPVSSTMNYRLFLALTLFSYILFIFTFVNISYYISCRNSVINSFIISLFISILLMLGFLILPGYSPISILRYEIFDKIYLYIIYIFIYIGLDIWILKKIFK